ncbi:hypothetical protein ACU686_29615 [Yinghuangia aomiensis]
MLAHQFPAHPDFDPDGTGTAVKSADARIVLGLIQAASESPDRQVEVPAKDRTVMRRIAVPLGLGQQKEVYFTLSTRWPDHFAREARAHAGPGDLSVIHLTEWIDRPEAMGLEPFLANLVIASFAEMDDRVWVRSGGPIPPPELTAVKPQDALRSQPRPEEADWEEAGRRFWEIFGEKPPTLRRGRLINQFSRQIVDKARHHQTDAADLVTQLEEHAQILDLDGSEPHGRLAIARRSRDILNDLLNLDRAVSSNTTAARQIITAFATFELAEVSASRYGASIKQAGAVADALAKAAWDMLRLAPTYGAAGEAVLAELRGAARVDQRTSDLKEALAEARRGIVKVIERAQAAAAAAAAASKPAGPEPAARTEPPTPTSPNDVDLSTDSSHPPVPSSHSTAETGTASRGSSRRSGGGRTKASRALAELHAELAELAASEPDATIEISWRVVE